MGVGLGRVENGAQPASSASVKSRTSGAINRRRE
jgi:hypothetical protein